MLVQLLFVFVINDFLFKTSPGFQVKNIHFHILNLCQLIQHDICSVPTLTINSVVNHTHYTGPHRLSSEPTETVEHH